MKSTILIVAAIALGSSAAFAEDKAVMVDSGSQSEITSQSFEAASARTTQQFTFDLDNTSGSSVTALPAGAADYEIGRPGEAATVNSFTFDLN